MGGMRRKAVAATLEMSVSNVRRLEGDLLHPMRGADGVWYFDPDEVQALQTTRRVAIEPDAISRGSADGGVDDAGDLAARLFPLFERGVSFAEAVQSTHARPSAVRALFWEWQQGYQRPVTPAPSRRAPPLATDDVDGADADDGDLFADWDAEVHAFERERANLDKLSRRYQKATRSHAGRFPGPPSGR